MLFRIIHTLSILTGPNIFLNICLSKMRKLFSSSAVKVQVSDKYYILLYLPLEHFCIYNPEDGFSTCRNMLHIFHGTI
jgi:hypothetical protein